MTFPKTLTCKLHVNKKEATTLNYCNLFIYKQREADMIRRPHDFESKGYVFYEALYAGCQLVTRAVGVAEASSQWKICSTPAEMTATLRNLLAANFENTQEMRFPVEKTVAEYMKIYNSLIAKRNAAKSGTKTSSYPASAI